MKKIFLTEDNPTEGFLIRLSLGQIENCSLNHYSNGNDLINSLEEQPNICIVDLNLPDISGIEVIETIREQSPNTKVIVVSSETDSEIIVNIQARYTPYYIIKSDAFLKNLKVMVEDLLAAQENAN